MTPRRLTPPAFFHLLKTCSVVDVSCCGKNAGYVLASICTLVTTPESSGVHSNVASHCLLLPLDNPKAGCLPLSM